MPAFDKRPLDEIKRGDIRDFLLRKSAKLSRKRTLLIKDVPSGVLSWAVDEELIGTNPTAGITSKLWPKAERGKRAITKDEAWNEAQLDAFLEACREREPRFYPFFLLLARTGCRLGEALALKWVNVDFAGRAILVKESYRRGRLTAPKNGKARRVDMSAQLAEVLQAVKPGPFVDVKELVFPGKQGTPYEQNEVRRVFDRMTTAARVKPIKLHGLRHTAASLLLSKGVSPYYVQRQLGHSSIQITCDVYGTLIRTDENQHVNLLDSVRQSAPPAHPGEIEKAITH
jgi:integrase